MGNDHFTQEEIDRIKKWEFEGLGDASRLMQKQLNRPKVVGRWDWHLWMFLVTTCIPCFGVYCLTMWVRAGSWEKHRKKQALQETTRASIEEPPTQTDITALEREIQRLKIMLLTSGKHSPNLPVKTWQRILDNDKEMEQKRKEVSPPDAEVKKKLRFSERVWQSVKPWLPFYVEPFHKRSNKSPPITDFTKIAKPGTFKP